MQKILVAMDAGHNQFPYLDIAAYIASLNGSKLTGVFLQDTVLPPQPAMRSVFGFPYVEEITTATTVDKEQKALLAQKIKAFTDACNRRGINSAVHCDTGVAWQELVRESRFAGCLIVYPAFSVHTGDALLPSGFLRQILYNAECPVLVAPANFTGIDEVVFAYNGSKSFVQSIRQFTYLFPQLVDKNFTLLQVKEDEDDKEFTDAANLKEWIMYHYSGVYYHIVHGNHADSELFNFLLEKQNAMLVIVAYSKHKWLGNSTAGMVLKMEDIPVFISHS